MQDLLQKLAVDFERFEHSMNGESQTELHKIRRSAFASLQAMGFPVRKAEEYKFTPLTKSLEKVLDGEAVTIENEVTPAFIKSEILSGDAINLVMVDGEFKKEYSGSTNEVEISSLWEAYAKSPEIVLAHFGKHAHYETDAFLAWNTAFAKNGLFISVGRKVELSKPIVIYHFFTSENAKKTCQSRNLILVAESAKLTIAEIYRTVGEGEQFSNIVSEIVVGKNARVEFTKVQNDHSKTYHYGLTQVHQSRDSHFTSNTVTLDGGMLRNNINIVIDDENIEAHMYGLYLLSGRTHVDNHTAVDHRKPNSFSNELYKGILDERSKGVFNGKIFVRREAQKTNAFQSNNNIMISNDATVNTKPQLEIWADDVKCSHGCTIGQLDEEAVFYLRARGVGEKDARAMLLYAFAKDAIEHISIDFLKEHLDKIIAKRLHTNE